MGFLLATIAFTALLRAAAAAEFWSDPSGLTVSAEFTSAAGRSEADCALQCESLRRSCASTAFEERTRLCLFSFMENADFSVFASRSSVWKKSLPEAETVIIDGREFRVIQQRLTGSVSFQRSWYDYENGFGDPSDFWVGLRTIHKLTGSSPRLLRVEVTNWASALFVCEFSGFTVRDASTNYTMTFASYLASSCNTTDSLRYHDGMQFSTMDRDNDRRGNSSCSQTYGNAGWWFGNCYLSNLNGIYSKTFVTGAMIWNGVGSSTPLRSTRLMLLL